MKRERYAFMCAFPMKIGDSALDFKSSDDPARARRIVC